jgi:CheY-like chemotaxis protein
MLEDLGHATQVVPVGHVALNVLRSDRTIDAVITDYAMPDMTGCRARHPDQPPAAGVAGDPGNGVCRLPEQHGAELARLSKPFGSHELASILTTLNQRSIAS